MIYKFVGGSLDGAEMEIHPEMNYRLSIPHPAEKHDFAEKPYYCEIYEITDLSQPEYHFVGYE